MTPKEETRTLELKSSIRPENEKLEELVDLVHLLFLAIDEVDLEEKQSLVNGLVHECNRMLSLYDPQREQLGPGVLPIDSPAFYNVYGQALYHLWYEKYEQYLALNERSIKHAKAEKNKERVKSIYASVANLRTELHDILKATVQKFKSAYTWSLNETAFKASNFSLSEEEQATLEEDMELLDTCSNVDSIRAELTRSYYLYLIWGSNMRQDDNVFKWMSNKLVKVQTQPNLICAETFSHTDANKEIADMLQEEAEFIKEQIVLAIKNETEWNMILDSVSISKADMKAFNVEEMEAWDFEDDDEDESSEDHDVSDNETLVTLPSNIDSLIHDPYIHALFILYESLSKHLTF